MVLDCTLGALCEHVHKTPAPGAPAVIEPLFRHRPRSTLQDEVLARLAPFLDDEPPHAAEAPGRPDDALLEERHLTLAANVFNF